MYPFVESLKYFNRQYFHLDFHQERFSRTRNDHYPGAPPVGLKSVLTFPEHLDANQVYKCRIVYGETVHEVSYEPYTRRNIQQYYLAVCPVEFDYSFKLANRTFFDNARKKLRENEDYIYVKNGLITDTSFANLVFYDGRHYYTPATPLLKGTKRAFYLKEGIIREEEIRVRDLQRFSSFFIINAMLDLEDSAVFSCDKLLLSHNQLKL